jgi:hypothetical protein
MSKKKLPPQTENEFAREIIKCLEICSSMSGFRVTQTFEHWLGIVEETLKAMPRHAKSLKENGTFAEDNEEGKKAFSVIEQYGRDNQENRDRCYQTFAEAFALLMMSASTGEYIDVLGNVYMQLGCGSIGLGQYFTPMNIAKCMAEMTMCDIERTIHDRIKDALCKSENVYGQAVLLTSIIVEPGEVQRFFFETVLPAAMPYYEPITVLDPAVGSGVMLLAAASAIPPWATQLGLVRFYGMDIDQTCVQMCRINIMLYGLNGSHIALFSELSPQAISNIPEPFSSLYKRAQEEPEAILEVTEEFNKARQLTLF